MAPEIAASTRQLDVERLIERVGRNDCKLIVIYGQSGVGKSSLINAGLEPALKNKAIGIKDNLPIVIRVYTNWQEECSKISQQLAVNEERNIRTVLIFDQFEEFFFVCTEPAQRREFFDFLAECLNVLSVKVILSLRVDYLHYLLECNDLSSMNIIGNDILSNNVLYKIGNFTPSDAKSIIQRLTQNANFPLEPALIDKLVEDLAGALGEVRPIELQIVGSQLQAENINTLAKYRLLGDKAKEELVKRYLQAVIENCGAENIQLAELLLYSLTDEKGTRPLKTRVELERDLENVITPSALSGAETSILDLVLEISVKSGLVLLLPEKPDDRYQLVHDYIATFIRQQQEPKLKVLIEELQKEREHRIVSERKLNKFLKRALVGSIAAVFGFATLAVTAGYQAWEANKQRQRADINGQAQIREIKALNQSSKANLVLNQQLEALVTSIKAAKQVKNVFVAPNLKVAVITTFQQTIYSVQERNRFEGHSDGVISVGFSPDGKIIASGSLDKTIKLWSRSGISKTLTGHIEPVYSIAFSPDGQILASSSVDKTVKLWNVQNGSLIKTLEGHTHNVNNVVFSPDGQTLASASSDKTIKIWSRIDGRLLKTIIGYNYPIMSVAFSPDSKNIAAGGEDKSIKIWDINDGRLLKTLSGHQGWVNSLSYSPDGKMLVSGGADKDIMLWNVSEGKLIKTIPGHTDSVWGVRFSPNSKMIISASRDRTIKLWNLNGYVLEEFKGHDKGVYNAVFSPDGKTIASVSLDGTVRLWQRRNMTQLDVLSAENGGVYAVAYSPDGSKIVAASGDGQVKIWRQDSTLLKTFTAHYGEIFSIAFAPNGEFATAGSDGAVKVWQDDKLIKTIKSHNTDINSISFSPDGSLIASASKDKTVKVYSLHNGQLLYTLKHAAEAYGVNFSPDGEILASASADKTIKLWRRTDGKLIQTLTGHKDWVYSATFSPDSQIIASASADKTIKLWRRTDEKLLQTLTGHEGEVYKASFSPDGNIIASVSEDATIKYWHINGQLLVTLPKTGAGIMSVNFSPNGKTVISGSLDNTVRVWRFDNQQTSIPELNALIESSCEWLGDYLKNNTRVTVEDKQLCSN